MLPTESFQEVVAFFNSFQLGALLLANRTFTSLASQQFLAGHLKFVRVECVDGYGYVYELLIGRVSDGATTVNRSQVARAALCDELMLKLSNSVIECMTVRCCEAAAKHVLSVLAKIGPSLAVCKLLRVYVARRCNTEDVIRQLSTFHKIMAIEFNWDCGSNCLRHRDVFDLCGSQNIASVTAVCPFCGSSFVEAASLTTHLVAHGSLFQCNLCGVITESISSLDALRHKEHCGRRIG